MNKQYLLSYILYSDETVFTYLDLVVQLYEVYKKDVFEWSRVNNVNKDLRYSEYCTKVSGIKEDASSILRSVRNCYVHDCLNWSMLQERFRELDASVVYAFCLHYKMTIEIEKVAKLRELTAGFIDQACELF